MSLKKNIYYSLVGLMFFITSCASYDSNNGQKLKLKNLTQKKIWAGKSSNDRVTLTIFKSRCRDQSILLKYCVIDGKIENPTDKVLERVEIEIKVYSSNDGTGQSIDTRYQTYTDIEPEATQLFHFFPKWGQSFRISSVDVY